MNEWVVVDELEYKPTWVFSFQKSSRLQTSDTNPGSINEVVDLNKLDS
jgi:hypothetical protein